MIYLVSCFLFIQTLSAAFVSNPAAPSLLQSSVFSSNRYLFDLSAGYVYDKVWDKKLRPENPLSSSCLESVKEFEIESNWAFVSITLLKRFSLYSYLGSSKESMDWRKKTVCSSEPSFSAKSHFSYSVGGKWLLLCFERFAIGADVQYFCLPSTKKISQIIHDWTFLEPFGSQHLRLKEWQVALGASKHFGPFCGYLGGKWNHTKLRVSSSDNLPDLFFENRFSFGTFAGLSIGLTKAFYATIEGRFIDEYALSFAAIASF